MGAPTIMLWLVHRSVCSRRHNPVHIVVQLTFRPIATVSFQCILADVQVRAPVTVPAAATVVKLAGHGVVKLKNVNTQHMFQRIAVNTEHTSENL